MENTAEVTQKKWGISTLFWWAFSFWMCWSLIGTVGYTYNLAEFYDIDYSFSEHGIALNGRTAFGSTIHLDDLEALPPKPNGSSVEEMCPNVASNRGYLVLGFVGDTAVCCTVGHEGQMHVPFKDEEGYRVYLCGDFPNLHEVKQPLDKVKYKM